MATMDSLTGLSNRRGFELAAGRSIEICERVQAPVALWYLDLDNLKLTNDNHGHAAGDRMLAAFADALRRTFRASDIVARVGGDEFCVLMAPRAQPDLGSLRERLRVQSEIVSEQLKLPEPLSFSVGEALRSSASNGCVADLMREADQAMYAEKHSRRLSGVRRLHLPDSVAVAGQRMSKEG